jgi:hypothetical protein
MVKAMKSTLALLVLAVALPPLGPRTAVGRLSKGALVGNWEGRVRDRTVRARFDGERAEFAVAYREAEVVHTPVAYAIDRQGVVTLGSVAQVRGVRRGQLRLTLLQANRFLPQGAAVTLRRVRPGRAE